MAEEYTTSLPANEMTQLEHINIELFLVLLMYTYRIGETAPFITRTEWVILFVFVAVVGLLLGWNITLRLDKRSDLV